MNSRVTFPTVTVADFEQLLALRIEAMRESLERIGRFDPARARQRLADSFDPQHTRFISLDGAVMGFYAFRPASDGYHLDHLYIAPACQGGGVGGYVLSQLIAEANRAGLPIFLGALRESDSNRFYQRHGFQKQREDAWDIYYIRPCDLPAHPPLNMSE